MHKRTLRTFALAVDAIATRHPAAISNSYGIAESSDAAALESHYNHPGIAITASTGDSSGVEFPASSQYVVAVGGTTLTRSTLSARGWSEAVLSNAGSGCSAFISRPRWQSAPSCSMRGVADVSFDVDVSPGLAVYSLRAGGWVVLGGTSAGAPFVAGLYAAARDYGPDATGAATLYARSAGLNRVHGSHGSDSTLGSPNGLSAF